jgi:hypothetical protein
MRLAATDGVGEDWGLSPAAGRSAKASSADFRRWAAGLNGV